MPSGSPDYGITAGAINQPSNTDVLELAARLNSIAMVNRSGQQISSICNSLVYSASFWGTTGNGGFLMPSTKFGHYNRPSLKMVTGVNSTDSTSVAFNGLPFQGQQIGVEFLLIMGSYAANLYLTFQACLNGVGYNAGIGIGLSASTIYYVNSAGSYVSLGTFRIPTSLGEPFSIKYSFNLATGNYGFLWFSSEQIMNLEQYQFQQQGACTQDTVLYTCNFANSSAAQQTLYLQDIITTIQEVV
jgi:hypothetical protein